MIAGLRVALWILGWAVAIVAAVPGAGRAQDGALDSAPDAVRVRLLDEVPNYAEILREQWTTGVRPDMAAREATHYGLLDDRGSARPITLEESIALALQHNTGLRIQALNPIAATARVRQSLAQFDPALYGDALKTRSTAPFTTISPFTSGGGSDEGIPPPEGVPPLQFQQEVDWNVGVRKQLLTGGRFSLDWTNTRLSSNPTVVNLVVPTYISALNATLAQPLLRDFGWRFALLIVDVAQLAEEQAFWEYKAQVADLVTMVEQAYWTYVLAIESVEVEEKGLELARELLRQNEGRFRVGSIARTAVLESEAEVARREANLVRVRALERIARDNLRAMINARDEAEDELLLIVPADQPTVTPVDLDLEERLARAFEQRPELIAARLNADGRKVERKIAENRLLPRLDLVGSGGLNGVGGSRAGPGIDVPGLEFMANPQVLGSYGRALELLTDGRFYQYQFGAVFEVPFANADAKARYAEAKVNAEAARLTVAQVEENVTLEITQAVNNLRALLKGIEATRIARELAAENVRNQQARYDVGLATTKDLIDFQDRLTQAERAEIDALATYNIEVARLRRADGTLLADRNIVLERAEPEPPPWWARF